MKLTHRTLLIPALFSLGLAGCAHDSAMSDMDAHPMHTANGAEYPMTTCVVSGEKLGEMGRPVEVTVQDHTFLLCCNACATEVRAHPDKYIQMLEQAEQGQAPAAQAQPTDGHQHHH